MATTTNMHYDANHNLLFVLKGSKRVALLPPSMAARVQAMPVGKRSLRACAPSSQRFAAGAAGKQIDGKLCAGRVYMGGYLLLRGRRRDQ